MLKIEDLHINIEGKEIVKGINLEIASGEIHALMGPNGSGKSTLAQALMGHPTYEITKGKVTFNGKNLLKMNPSERSLAGLFLSFQYPSEVLGVNIANFLRLVYNKRVKKTLYPAAFRKLLKEKMEILDMKEEFMDRYLNHIKPDKVHVMRNGKIVKSGGHELANELEKKGYTAFEE